MITGTRGAGKTTLADILVGDGSAIRVGSITTRPPRADDLPGTYSYTSDAEFEALLDASRLVLVSRYGEFRYGISAESIAAVRRSGRIPLMTVSPDATARLLRDEVRWRGAFIDARDDVLDSRLAAAGRPAGEWDRRRRAVDRRFAAEPLVVVDNSGGVTGTTAELRRVLGLSGALRAGSS